MGCGSSWSNTAAGGPDTSQSSDGDGEGDLSVVVATTHGAEGLTAQRGDNTAANRHDPSTSLAAAISSDMTVPRSSTATVAYSSSHAKHDAQGGGGGVGAAVALDFAAARMKLIRWRRQFTVERRMELVNLRVAAAKGVEALFLSSASATLQDDAGEGGDATNRHSGSAGSATAWGSSLRPAAWSFWGTARHAVLRVPRAAAVGGGGGSFSAERIREVGTARQVSFLNFAVTSADGCSAEGEKGASKTAVRGATAPDRTPLPLLAAARKDPAVAVIVAEQLRTLALVGHANLVNVVAVGPPPGGGGGAEKPLFESGTCGASWSLIPGKPGNDADQPHDGANNTAGAIVFRLVKECFPVVSSYFPFLADSDSLGTGLLSSSLQDLPSTPRPSSLRWFVLAASIVDAMRFLHCHGISHGAFTLDCVRVTTEPSDASVPPPTRYFVDNAGLGPAMNVFSASERFVHFPLCRVSSAYFPPELVACERGAPSPIEGESGGDGLQKKHVGSAAASRSAAMLSPRLKHAADMWSVGVTLFRAVYGEDPFVDVKQQQDPLVQFVSSALADPAALGASAKEDLFRRILGHTPAVMRPPPLSDGELVPLLVMEAIELCLAKDPLQRPTALELALKGLSLEAPPASVEAAARVREAAARPQLQQQPQGSSSLALSLVSDEGDMDVVSSGVVGPSVLPPPIPRPNAPPATVLSGEWADVRTPALPDGLAGSAMAAIPSSTKAAAAVPVTTVAVAAGADALPVAWCPPLPLGLSSASLLPAPKLKSTTGGTSPEPCDLPLSLEHNLLQTPRLADAAASCARAAAVIAKSTGSTAHPVASAQLAATGRQPRVTPPPLCRDGFVLLTIATPVAATPVTSWAKDSPPASPASAERSAQSSKGNAAADSSPEVWPLLLRCSRCGGSVHRQIAFCRHAEHQPTNNNNNTCSWATAALLDCSGSSSSDCFSESALLLCRRCFDPERDRGFLPYAVEAMSEEKLLRTLAGKGGGLVRQLSRLGTPDSELLEHTSSGAISTKTAQFAPSVAALRNATNVSLLCFSASETFERSTDSPPLDVSFARQRLRRILMVPISQLTERERAIFTMTERLPDGPLEAMRAASAGRRGSSSAAGGEAAFGSPRGSFTPGTPSTFIDCGFVGSPTVLPHQPPPAPPGANTAAPDVSSSLQQPSTCDSPSTSSRERDANARDSSLVGFAAANAVVHALDDKEDSVHLHGLSLTQLPWSLFELPLATRVTLLDLSNNKLAGLPPCLSALITLRRLLVGNNFLAALPESLCDLPCLVSIDANHNLLTGLPLSLVLSETIEVIAIDSNDVSCVPDVAFQMPVLRVIYLSDNPRLMAAPSAGVLSTLSHPLLVGLDNAPSLLRGVAVLLHRKGRVVDASTAGPTTSAAGLDFLEVIWNKIFPDEVVPGLVYLGGLRCAESSNVFHVLGIKRVLTVGHSAPLHTVSPEAVHATLMVDEPTSDATASSESTQTLREGAAFIAESVQRCEPCLVHCFTGTSRSAAIVIGYLMIAQRLRFDVAYRRCLEARPTVALSAQCFSLLVALDSELYPRSPPLDYFF